MNFTGSWYKNGPIQKKGKHPFIGTGNIVKLDFEKGKFKSVKETKVIKEDYKLLMPLHEKEANLNVIPLKDTILALSEMTFPHELNMNTLQPKFPFNLPYIPASVHPKYVDEVYWNSYIYGNMLVLYKDKSLYKVFHLEDYYYIHDFYMHDEYFVWIPVKTDYDLTKPGIDALKFVYPSIICIYDRKTEEFHQLNLPESIKDRFYSHIGNITVDTNNNIYINAFSVEKDFSYNDVKRLWDINSIPVSIKVSLKQQETYLEQYWNHITGDLPKEIDEGNLVFINKNTLHKWLTKDKIMINKTYDTLILEEPVSPDNTHVLCIGHHLDNLSTDIMTFDNKLNLLDVQTVDKINYSIHGNWVDKTIT